MADTSQTRWRGLAGRAAIVALAALARLPYLRRPNLSPDAVDYLNIATVAVQSGWLCSGPPPGLSR